MNNTKKKNNKIIDGNEAKAIEILNPLDDRDMLLHTLGDTISNLKYKTEKGKIKNAKNESVKVNYNRALIYAISTYNSILKDRQIDKLATQIEDLKRGIKTPNEDNTTIEDDVEELEKLINKIGDDNNE